MDIFDKN